MDQTELDWRRLGELVRDARIRRGYRTQRALAEAMGVSSKLVNNIELGKNTSYSPSSLIALEVALGWGRGSVDHVLMGLEPTEAKPGTLLYNWQRLGDHVRLRREELGMSRADITARGGPPEETFARIEAGQPIRDLSVLSGLDHALGWFQGSSLQVLEGLDPRPHPGPSPRPRNPADAASPAAVNDIRTIMQLGAESRDRLVPIARQLTYEELWQQWFEHQAAIVNLEAEYARRRGISADGVSAELWEVVIRSRQARDTGREWVPPWEELSDDEALDRIEELRAAGLIDEHGEPIEQPVDEPPHRPIPEPAFEPGDFEHDVRTNDEGGYGREFRFSAPAVDRPLVAEVETKDAARSDEVDAQENPQRPRQDPRAG